MIETDNLNQVLFLQSGPTDSNRPPTAVPNNVLRMRVPTASNNRREVRYKALI